MQEIKTHLADPMTEHGKMGFTRPPKPDEDHETANCDVCGTELQFVKDSLYPIKAVACPGCQPNWIPVPRYEPKSAVVASESRPETCPDCGGKRAGRGYAHNEGCDVATVKPKGEVKTCPACGGPKRGKGYTHKPDCSDVKARQEAATKVRQEAASKPVETCAACGGPKRGKGYTHKPGCSTLPPKAPVEICPTCGGSKRGKGFTHIGDCPAKKAAKPKGRPRMARRPRL